jgi:arginine utilization protein RocB
MVNRAREIALELTSWPSVTGTPGEAAFADKLIDLLKRSAALSAAGLLVEKWPIPGDALGRANVVAHLPGAGQGAVVLAGHFDVVPVEDYGALSELAWRPTELAPALIEKLRSSGANPQALADLESGDYLPGRGLLDMKSGLAAGIAAMERHAADRERRGHLVLIATPDEEDRSAGMRAAATALPAWQKARDLDVRLGINLDALCDTGDGAAGRTVAFGCIGKLLLSALVVGQDAHACYPLAGVNGSYLTAELIAELEYAPELGEETGSDLASPPTVLASRDLKSIYNVTTPTRTWTIWNVLTQRRTSTDVLARAAAAAQRAIGRAQHRMRDRAKALRNTPIESDGWSRIKVMTFAEVYQLAVSGNHAFAAAFTTKAATLAQESGLDFPARCQRLTEFAWDAAGIQHPAIVLGFASMPYPSVSWSTDAASAALAARIKDVAAAIGERHAQPIRSVDYLEVIADMIFLGAVDSADLRVTAQETPIWGTSIDWDLSGQVSPGFPMVNIGPWGRDYHHHLERVHADYAFSVLPDLVFSVAQAALEQRAS